ncbi:conserved Plasmodium membrane protein, unknown function [Plasmodium reichenowi]|uniref:Phosphatidate cytidylyltransferase n=13 Tax=Plasmodium (Laverania) TaxID=418107 RepID=C0H4M5_PLAF7|nr:conserved protein, unknown function [Plasmodium falciparum 3D7]XP_012762200.1 putative membrane protein [Plasmodium reichenowi]ACY25745.1 CTP transferase 1 domain-containing protein [Plasmodium falciparum]ETW19502.1 hypothetical protein PFFVO_01683 [Plasmodium falciparum Vietnam Oak-Knoll (FVO)]ETW43877.1 hypothetical protein PFNF135_01811 [Plasmodium falciparum NF135/5.C10]ETW50296.1 hypothetical protein PFMALIP_01718 [Plasmodium falciparum MaliPS096_E11]ETW57292.1 hypothetical protein PF|eukprot:XP_002808772.1 conserved Plasmodium membrane protein, unknown function [Plasmodium falciparum 3D7]
MNCFVLFVIVVALVTILDQCKQIPKFYARKFAHMLCGLLILMFDVSINGYRRGLPHNIRNIIQTDYRVYFIYLIAITSILRCFFYPFRFGVYKDKGIIVYNVIVSIFFFFKLPLYVLTPIFFADPMAAIVGRQFPNYAIYKKKTLHGTLTCFFVSLVTLFYVGNYWHILILSLSLSFLELFGGSFDNLLMCFPIFIYMTFFKV